MADKLCTAFFGVAGVDLLEEIPGFSVFDWHRKIGAHNEVATGVDAVGRLLFALRAIRA